MNLADLIILFKSHHDFHQLAASTRSEYKRYYSRLPTYLVNTDTSLLTVSDFFHYFDSFPSAPSANRCKAAVQKVFSWSYQRGYCEINLVAGITKRKEFPRTKYITDEEYLLTYALASIPCKCAMELAYLCIARISEVLNIQLSDIQPRGLLLTNSKNGLPKYNEYTHRLTSAIDLAKSLYAGPYPRKHLICKPDGSRYTVRALQEQYAKAKAKAGLSGFTFHDIKAKGYSDFEGDRVAKQLAARHKTINMGQIYDRRIPIVKSTR